MKHLSKVIGIAMLLFSVFACSDGANEVLNSRIAEKEDHANKRTTATTLILTTPLVVTTNVYYDTLIVRNGGSIEVKNGGKFQCYWYKNEVNHTYSADFSVASGGTLQITYTLNAGNTHITNLGTLLTGQFDSYFSGCYINNYNYHKATGSTLFSAGNYNNSGLFTNGGSSSQFLQLSGTGKYNSAVCGQAIQPMLIVDSPNAVTGSGRINVTVQSYLNQVMTSSSGIRFCTASYSGLPPSNVGSATIDCNQASCF